MKLWNNLTKPMPTNGPRVKIGELLTAKAGSNSHGLCGRCSYHGCIELTRKHGVLGHYLWTLQSISKRLSEFFSLTRIRYNFSQLDYSQITNAHVANINMKDMPDFVDAFIESATYKGRDMTEAELDRLNQDTDYVYNQVLEVIY